jgi:hypothetical protein
VAKTLVDPICYCVAVWPDLTDDGELPPGVQLAIWEEFESRFSVSSPRRLWLYGRIRDLVELAAATGKLRRVFVWGSLVTAKPAPRDLDILLIMDENFEVDQIAGPGQEVFDSTRAKLLFESDIFWRGIVELELPVIQTDEQMLLAQRCVGNLRAVLLEARKVHSRQDYTRMAEPILLEIQQREQEILEYLSRDLERPIAS